MIIISQFSSDPQPLQENIDDINHGVVKLSAMVGKENKKKVSSPAYGLQYWNEILLASRLLVIAASSNAVTSKGAQKKGREKK